MNKLHWIPPKEPFCGTGPPIGFRVMENTSTRNAFWCSWLEKDDDNKWNAVWWFGRIGTFGKKGSRPFNGQVAAAAWLNAKRTEKFGSGYVTVAEVETLLKAPPAASVKEKDTSPPLSAARAKTILAAEKTAEPVAAQPIAEFDPLEVLWL